EHDFKSGKPRQREFSAARVPVLFLRGGCSFTASQSGSANLADAGLAGHEQRESRSLLDWGRMSEYPKLESANEAQRWSHGSTKTGQSNGKPTSGVPNQDLSLRSLADSRKLLPEAGLSLTLFDSPPIEMSSKESMTTGKLCFQTKPDLRATSRQRRTAVCSSTNRIQSKARSRWTSTCTVNSPVWLAHFRSTMARTFI